MTRYKEQRAQLAREGMFTGKEKKRFVGMAVASVVVIGALAYTALRVTPGESTANVPDTPQVELALVVPEIDGERLGALVEDAAESDRVKLERPALEAAISAARGIRDNVFDDMGGVPLDTAIVGEMGAAPDEHRGRLVRAWGRIESYEELHSADGSELRHLMLLGAEDAGRVWFVTPDIGDAVPSVDEFVRLDGFFLKNHRRDTAEGWVDAPLLVAPRAHGSWPRLEPVRDVASIQLGFVRDDGPEGMYGILSEEYWELVSYVDNLAPDAVDWAEAPVLDNKLLARIYDDGTPYRGRAIRLPVCKILGIGAMAQSENPLRRRKLVEGWLGHGGWTGQAPVVRFVGPRLGEDDWNEGDEIYARGFFFKNHGYTPRDGGLGLAPFFVLESVELFVPPDNVGMRQLLYLTAGLAIGLAVLIFFLLKRDRARSEALQEDLRRRRKARRARVSASATGLDGAAPN